MSLTGILVDPAHGIVSISGDQIEWTPAKDDTSATSFVYSVTDGTAVTTATVFLSVTPVDDAPIGVPDTFTADEDAAFADNVLDNDLDVDSVPVVSLTTGPAIGSVTLEPDGTFVWTRPLDFVGTDSFEYQISDATTAVSPVHVDLTVLALNDAPRPIADAFFGNEGLPISDSVATNDSDPEGDAILYTLTADATHGSVVLDPTSGAFVYTPDGTDYNGPDSFSYSVSDGLDASGEVLVDLVILPVDDAPVAVEDTFDGVENVSLNLPVLDNDFDIEGDAMVAMVDTNPAFGGLTPAANGSLDYVPNPGFFGEDSFTYHASANGLDSLPVTVTVAIAEVDDAPIGMADAFETPENTVLLGDVLGNDFDPNGDAMSVTVSLNAAHGNLLLLPSGSFNYTPLVNYVGPDVFQYVITARSLTSAPVTVSIDVVAPLDTGETGVAAETGDTGKTEGDADTDADSDSDTDTDTDCELTTWYADTDSDGYGNPDRFQDACEQPVGFVARTGDCNDIDADINPEGQEVAGNDEDEDCIDGPLQVEGEGKGCGCDSTRAAPGIAILLAAWAARRRRS